MSSSSDSPLTYEPSKLLESAGVTIDYDKSSNVSLIIFIIIIICLIVGVICIIKKIYSCFKKSHKKKKQFKEPEEHGPKADEPLEPQENQPIDEIVNKAVSDKMDKIKNKVEGILEDEKYENFKLLK